MFKDALKIHQLRERYGSEQVFVVPTSTVMDIPDGFSKQAHTKDIYKKFDSIGKYIYRYDAEENVSFQQIIPYVILYNPIEGTYLVYTRQSGSKENRLHNQISIGFGGHIDSGDGINEVVFKGLVRELMEEVEYQNTEGLSFIGYVRDQSSKTYDHLGLVFELPVSMAEVKETEKYNGEWMTKEQLQENYFKFEGWAKYIIDYILHN